jgi:mannose/fructose/N-acetylgalactosamine-specific phosphotransferase system component IIC
MDLLLVAALGTVLALDTTSVGQTMISRPLVAGPLTGWLLGDPSLGLAVGAVLELYLLVSFPSGGARFPEASTGTVVAVASVASLDSAGAVPLGVAMGLVWGQLGGFTVTAVRRLNGRLVPGPDDPRPERVSAAHLAALALDGLRGATLAVAGAVVGRWAAPLLAAGWPLGDADSRGLLLMGGAISAGVLLRTVGGFRAHRILFAAGMALAVVGARFL